MNTTQQGARLSDLKGGDRHPCEEAFALKDHVFFIGRPNLGDPASCIVNCQNPVSGTVDRDMHQQGRRPIGKRMTAAEPKSLMWQTRNLHKAPLSEGAILHVVSLIGQLAPVSLLTS